MRNGPSNITTTSLEIPNAITIRSRRKDGSSEALYRDYSRQRIDSQRNRDKKT